MTVSWIALLLAFATLLGFLSTAILLLNKLRYRFFLYPLILNLSVTTLWIVHRFLIETRLVLEVPHLFRLMTPIAAMAGPTLYLYVRSLLNSEVNWGKNDWGHFIPPILAAIFLVPFYARSALEKRAWLEVLYQEPSRFAHFAESVLPRYFQHIFVAGIVFLYGVFAFVLILKYLNKTTDDRLKIREESIRWILFHTGISVLMGIMGMSVFAIESLPQGYYFSILNTLAALLFFPLFLLLFFNPAILYGIKDKEFREIREKEASSEAYFPYGLDLHKIQEIKRALVAYMETSKPFLYKEISLPQLAEQLQVSRHQLSYVINREYRTNYNAYINDLRIEHCLNHFTREQWNAYTLDAIADKIGFGSRGTFIRSFRKKTSKLPSEYRKSILEGMDSE